VLCINTLSRQLDGKHKKLNAPTESGMHAKKHLIFVDDMKLMTESDEDLKMLMKETKKSFKAIGLKMNKDKSADRF
jgi:Reverse transcriptase (RNA-dependent DNA polymerase)